MMRYLTQQTPVALVLFKFMDIELYVIIIISKLLRGSSNISRFIWVSANPPPHAHLIQNDHLMYPLPPIY